MATFSCDDSSSRRSFRICCEGNRDARLRQQKHKVWEGDAARDVNERMKALRPTSDCILSSAWRREQSRRERERGRQLLCGEEARARGGPGGGGVAQKREEAETVLAPAHPRTGPDVLLGFR